MTLVIETMPIKELIPYAGNAKEHPPAQVKQIVASIEEFGFNDPIAIDENNVLIEGHGRLLAAKRLKIKDLPIIRLSHLDEAQKRAYIIAHNKLTMNTGFDVEKLRVEFEILQELKFDLTKTGFEITEVGDYIKGVEEKPLPVDPDDIPATPKQAVTRPGDIYEIGHHRLICGDTTDQTVVTALLNGEKPSLMITDPPYGVEYDPSWREGNDLNIGKGFNGQQGRALGKVSNDDRADWRETWALFPGNIAYVWHGALHAAEVQNSLESQNFKIRSQIVWIKQHFVFSRGDYHWQHEPCWYAVKGTGNWTGDRKQTTVWEINNNNPFGTGAKMEEKTGHGTQKPVECMARPMRNHGQKGDIVYDPFLGSGSTMVAAQMEGRRCYGGELSPEYCDVIVARMKRLFPDLWIARNGEPC